MIWWIVVAGYVAVIAVGAGAQLYSWRRPERFAPLGEMLDRVMVERTTRVALIAAWWWFGWHFLFARTV